MINKTTVIILSIALSIMAETVMVITLKDQVLTEDVSAINTLLIANDTLHSLNKTNLGDIKSITFYEDDIVTSTKFSENHNLNFYVSGHEIVVNTTDESNISVAIYNLKRQKVAALFNGRSLGKITFNVNNLGLPTGLYSSMVTINNRAFARKILIK